MVHRSIHLPVRIGLVFMLAFALLIGISSQAAQAFSVNPATVFINELHYDNDGTDAGEAIEVAGPAGTDLSGYSLVLYNGNGGAAYDTRALSGVIPDQQAGYGTLAFAYPPNGIQNGAPDGIALLNGSTVAQFLSYEGTFAAVGGPADGLASTDIGVAEGSSTPPGSSLQLGGSGTAYQNFAWQAAAANTFGAVNNGQTFDGSPPPTTSPTPVPSPTPAPITARIHDIQGAAQVSPLDGSAVAGVPGIVTALRSNGFYMQDPQPDADAATSEGILVFTSAAPTVAVGDAVLVNGTVTEFRPGGSGGANNLSTTEISNPGRVVTVQSNGNPLPAPTVIGNGGRMPPASVIEDDTNGDVETSANTFDPTKDGIDFYESLEGMLVQVNDAVATGPTSSFGEIPVLADNGANAGIRTARGGIVVSPDDFNPERIILDDAIVSDPPMVNVGDRFGGAIVGVIDYGFGNFKLLNTLPLPAVVSGGLTREITTVAPKGNQLTVATFNVENLSPNDDAAKFSALANLIVTNLKSPDIISLEEVQDNDGATNDGVVDASVTLDTLVAAIQAAGGPAYTYRQISPVDGQDGGQPGGNIRVAFLFNPKDVRFVDRPGGTATDSTTVVAGKKGPELSFSPGRIQPTDSAFESSRKPLVGEFFFKGRTYFVIANHFNSKGGDQPLFGRFQPPTLNSAVQRVQQAQIVNTFVDDILALDPAANVVVLGDLNDFEFSEPLQVLKGGVLNDLVDTLPKEQRYTYVFDGNSQVLDHILVSNSLFNSADLQYDVVHVNAEFADQASDHDPSVAAFDPGRLQAVRPVLECVAANANGSYTAFFGYKNDNAGAVTIPIGANNKFTPAPIDRGQPSTFSPGRQRSVFSLTFDGGNTVWTLNGRTATASRNPAQRCR